MASRKVLDEDEDSQENENISQKIVTVHKSVTHIGVINGPVTIGPQFNNFPPGFYVQPPMPTQFSVSFLFEFISVPFLVHFHFDISCYTFLVNFFIRFCLIFCTFQAHFSSIFSAF